MAEGHPTRYQDDGKRWDIGANGPGRVHGDRDRRWSSQDKQTCRLKVVRRRSASCNGFSQLARRIRKTANHQAIKDRAAWPARRFIQGTYYLLILPTLGAGGRQRITAGAGVTYNDGDSHLAANRGPSLHLRCRPESRGLATSINQRWMF
jgi:hypothetical protein